MSSRSFLRAAAAVLAVGLVTLLAPPRAGASFTVNSGYDLFQTVTPGTVFNGVQFQGVPLGTFNFGGAIGLQNVGNTDTIVHRLQDAVVSGAGQSATINLQMVALQLQSVTPTDFGLGTDFYFVTLQSARAAGGPASPGSMTITFAAEPSGPPPPQPVHGTFSSSIDVFFDVRKGSLTGPIALSSDIVINSSGTSWSHFPHPGAIQIPGVNTFLDGSDRLGDFWPATPSGDGGLVLITETNTNGSETHLVRPGTPEPAAVVSTGLGLLCLGFVAGLRARRRIARVEW